LFEHEAREAFLPARHGACFSQESQAQGAAMNPIFDEKTRDGEITRALNIALHTLSVHSGAQVTMEGETFTLNFTRESAAIMHALKLLGVPPNETLPAPDLDAFDLRKKIPGV
jgi:hypothetical protein